MPFRVLVVDRDSLVLQLVSSKIRALGCDVVPLESKQEAMDLLARENFDVVLIDPSPMTKPKSLVFNIWELMKKAETRPYVMFLSKTITPEEAIANGANDVVRKPVDNQQLEEKIGNAERLMQYSRALAKADRIEPLRGIIDRWSFNQLFLSCIDRAFRYAELSFAVFISIDDYEAASKKLGMERNGQLILNLADRIVHMRRQSDVIGRIDEGSFGILLQRPIYESEPFDALWKFVEVLSEFLATLSGDEAQTRLKIEMMEFPMGRLHASIPLPLAAAAGTKPAPQYLADDDGFGAHEQQA